MNKLDETHRYATLANKVHKRRIKSEYDRSIQPCLLNGGDLVLTMTRNTINWEVENYNPCVMGLTFLVVYYRKELTSL